MHRNTYLVVIFLAILAALIVGVNIGKKLSPSTPLIVSTPTPVPTPQAIPYTNNFCGFSMEYPKTFTILENASGSAILNNPQNKAESITITCQKDIPRPPLTADKIESVSFPTTTGATVSAKLYHDASVKDGAPIDALIFRHPKNTMDIFIAGFGDTFNKAIQTITILP